MSSFQIRYQNHRHVSSENVTDLCSITVSHTKVTRRAYRLRIKFCEAAFQSKKMIVHVMQHYLPLRLSSVTTAPTPTSVTGCSDCCNRYHRCMRVIVRCLVLKQPDCMSLIVEASRSIFARDGPVLLKAVTTWQMGHYT